MLYVCSNTRCGWRHEMDLFFYFSRLSSCVCVVMFKVTRACAGASYYHGGGGGATRRSPAGPSAGQPRSSVQWWGPLAARLRRGSASLQLIFYIFFCCDLNFRLRRIAPTDSFPPPSSANPSLHPFVSDFDSALLDRIVPPASIRPQWPPRRSRSSSRRRSPRSSCPKKSASSSSPPV